MPLTAVAIKNFKPQAKPVKLADGGGLYLLVQPSGSRLWRMKYRFGGKEKVLSFGGLDMVSLAEARALHDAAKKLLKNGADPMQERKDSQRTKAQSQENSFEAVARAWWPIWSKTRTPRHAGYVIRRLEADVFPKIGHKSVADIKPPDIAAIGAAINARGARDLAGRALQSCGQVFRYAIANGYCETNPVAQIKPSEVLGENRATNYARLEAKELPDLIRHIEAYQGNAITRLALKLMALTFVRTTELINARWDEFDLDAALWDIAASRMKMRQNHVVPLSSQALEVLRVLRLVSGNGALVFPGERDHDKPMSNNTILKALERMGYKGRMTGHGFRGIASTQLNEMGYRPEWIELQLAHQKRNKVEAAYNKAKHLAERRKMMQDWANYLDASVSGNVVAGRFGTTD
jgi:integrase